MITARTRPLTAVLLHLALLLGTIFSVFPIYFVVQASLRPGNTLYSTQLQLLPVNATLDNYRYMLTQTELPLWLWNSTKVALSTTAATLLITVTAAYALSRFRFRGRGLLLGGMLALQAFPGFLSIVAFYLILNRLGLTNTHLGLILIYAAGAIVFNVWNLKGYFDTIPVDLEEAAMIDGCTPTQAFVRVMLPLARPSLAVTALFGFLAGWNEYIFAQTLLFDESKYTAPVGIFALQDTYSQPWGWFAASSLIVSVPVVILFLYLQRSLVSGLSAGGVKG
ncbi:MAG TPA: sugar ABC transporter permease [Kouleothrix sp.]|uniref:sugar ABC transporter permease n=1 Tax=Kouleothrix sp. TaxID=2779161 RepID=UPI002BC6B684|nr:sugar ABC transporter permease [Kouleothrix sp.]HRC76291.1 sugar ABC transporter permease [Kouleothrix sp.]